MAYGCRAWTPSAHAKSCWPPSGSRSSRRSPRLERGGPEEGDERREPGDFDSEGLYQDEFDAGRAEDLKRPPRGGRAGRGAPRRRHLRALGPQRRADPRRAAGGQPDRRADGRGGRAGAPDGEGQVPDLDLRRRLSRRSRTRARSTRSAKAGWRCTSGSSSSPPGASRTAARAARSTPATRSCDEAPARHRRRGHGPQHVRPGPRPLDRAALERLVGRRAALPRPGLRPHPPRARAADPAARPPSTSSPTGPERAVELAREAAGDHDVSVGGGGETIQQLIRAGLLDELLINQVPADPRRRHPPARRHPAEREAGADAGGRGPRRRPPLLLGRLTSQL